MVEDSKNEVQSVGKTFAVLPSFRADAPELSISEVAASAGLDRGMTFRLIHTMVDLGYLTAVPGTRRFWLTLKCLELGYSALAAGKLKVRRAPMPQRLIMRSGERIPSSDATLTDLDELCAGLNEVRGRGYAILNGEDAFGLRTVAAPISWPGGAVRAIISLTIRTARQELDPFVAAAMSTLLQATRALSDAVRLSAAT